jgi:hypothetical protein
MGGFPALALDVGFAPMLISSRQQRRFRKRTFSATPPSSSAGVSLVFTQDVVSAGDEGLTVSATKGRNQIGISAGQLASRSPCCEHSVDPCARGVAPLLPSGDLANEMFAFADAAIKAQAAARALREP